MGLGTHLLIGLAMAVGLIGVLVPVIPGLLLIGAAALWWALLGEGIGPWVVFGLMVLVLAIGTAAKYVLPSRTLRQAGAPASTLVLGAVGGIVGFFVIPVIGILVGAVAGIFAGELRRLPDFRAARRSTLSTLKAIGIGVLIELLAGVVAVSIWFVSVIAGVG
ncbi:MAG: DUF456 domain-containing protein [Geodermatophilaceae bacterium]|nr:DUF456 domain-containing protein [Geodermatophilaceae bacterium]